MSRELTEEEWKILFDGNNDEWISNLYKHGYRVIEEGKEA